MYELGNDRLKNISDYTATCVYYSIILRELLIQCVQFLHRVVVDVFHSAMDAMHDYALEMTDCSCVDCGRLTGLGYLWSWFI